MESHERATPSGQLTLSEEQRSRLHRVACELLSAAARQQPASIDRLPLGGLADTPVVGVFVTLRKDGALRGCIGNFTQSIQLGDALERAATGAACQDPRFPPVRPEELEQLTVEVSLLHSRELLGDSPDVRLSSIVISRHGLDIQYYGRTGLLLPSVAVDHGWDAFTFLCEVCRKAGLPVDTWKDPGATVYRFSATHWGGPFAVNVHGE
jgi:AmmeMemoRadiSam system protein A